MGYERLWVNTSLLKIDSKFEIKREKKNRNIFGIINDYSTLFWPKNI
jgi:hypothetical protein